MSRRRAVRARTGGVIRQEIDRAFGFLVTIDEIDRLLL